MEYILISESKLKIMLTRQDIEEWNISVEELDYGNPGAKAVFEEILGYAREELSFDTSGHKVLLQLYPSKDGGCELFITRLGESTERGALKPARAKQRQKAYSFQKLSHLLAVCKRLSLNGFTGESSAWFDSEGKWFLLLSTDEDSELDLLPLDRFSFICEYGDTESPKALSLYLSEYASPVCRDNASAILGKI